MCVCVRSCVRAFSTYQCADYHINCRQLEMLNIGNFPMKTACGNGLAKNLVASQYVSIDYTINSLGRLRVMETRDRLA